jgi:hypothetical protein
MEGKLELTRFRGHLILTEVGVRNGQDPTPYPAEFRRQMIELVQAGKTPAELAQIASRGQRPD